MEIPSLICGEFLLSFFIISIEYYTQLSRDSTVDVINYIVTSW